MEEDPKGQKPEASGEGKEESPSPPPFEPDPELVTYLERGPKDDAPGKFRQALKRLLGEN
jgi:hypothetical protein